MRLAFGMTASYVNRPCSGALPLPLATRPVLSSPPADPGQAVPSGPQWVHEIKHDGFRFICRREGNRIACFLDAATIDRPRHDRDTLADSQLR
jgi:hypothetical protein